MTESDGSEDGEVFQAMEPLVYETKGLRNTRGGTFWLSLKSLLEGRNSGMFLV